MFGWLSRNKPNLNFAWIKAKTEELSGLSDWGDEQGLKNLEVLLESFRTEAACPLIARREFQGMVVHYAMQRLAIVDLLKKHPEIEDIPVEKPVFIAGLPRTGTTLLHRLMGADPAGRPLLLWEATSPLPPPQPETHLKDPRIDEVNANLAGFYQMAPQFKMMHPQQAQAPDECGPFFMRNFVSLNFAGMFNLPSMLEYLTHIDMRPSYRLHKQQLQILSWKFPKQHWVLKEPSHLVYLDALFDVYPDARILLTHRDPLDVVASNCSLNCYARYVSSHGACSNPKEIGPWQLGLLGVGWDRNTEMRKHLDPKRIYDVSYRRMLKDPIAEINQIYGYFNQTFTQEARTNMQTWLEQNRQHKHGKHHYSLEQFGLSKESVQKGFTSYYKTYDSFIKE